MKRHPFKTILAALLIPALCALLCGCGTSSAEPANLSFSASNSINELKALDGKAVSIVGYMATLSPLDGKYMYLMNLPYQSCPFCVPNTQQLANTMAVYAKSGKSFEFTDQAVRVTGKLKVEHCTDEYGYEYEYRIVDAEAKPVDLSAVKPEYALWTSLAGDGVIGEIYTMFDYLYFICQWSEYTLNYTDENGQAQQAYMYPGDVQQFMEEDAPYGYKTESAEGYFDTLISRVRAISPDQLEDLVEILNRCREVRDYAMSELNARQYTYIEDLDKYKQTHFDELYERWYEVWAAFAGDWVSKWQL